MDNKVESAETTVIAARHFLTASLFLVFDTLIWLKSPNIFCGHCNSICQSGSTYVINDVHP